MSGQVRPRQGTEICNFGAPSPWRLSTGFFCFFSSIYVQFSKTSSLKSGESSEKSSGENRVKCCHVCGCHGFAGFRKWDSSGLCPFPLRKMTGREQRGGRTFGPIPRNLHLGFFRGFLLLWLRRAVTNIDYPPFFFLIASIF